MKKQFFYVLVGFLFFACSDRDLELVDSDRVESEFVDSYDPANVDRTSFTKLNRNKQIDLWQTLTPKKKYELWAQKYDAMSIRFRDDEAVSKFLNEILKVVQPSLFEQEPSSEDEMVFDELVRKAIEEWNLPKYFVYHTVFSLEDYPDVSLRGRDAGFTYLGDEDLGKMCECRKGAWCDWATFGDMENCDNRMCTRIIGCGYILLFECRGRCHS